VCMNTELLQEYRTFLKITPEQMIPWLENRLRMFGFNVETIGRDMLSAALDSGNPGDKTVFQIDAYPQLMEDGTVAHTRGNDAACVMLLYALRKTAQMGLQSGQVRVLICGSEVCSPNAGANRIEISLAKASEAKLGEAIVCGSAMAANTTILDDCLKAAKSVMGSVSVKTDSEADACRILIGANPVPDIGLPGMKFHMLALENGADVLTELIRLRHSS